MQRIQIFKTGNHTSEDGRQWSFPEDVVRQLVDNYDPAVFAAPLVVGHPALDAPAYGQVAQLVLNGDTVEMEPVHVEPQFAALVNAKRFPNVSASFFPPEHPSNPKPGQWYLRHVGFLGAAAPAIPGLKPASFNGTADGVVTLAFAAAATLNPQEEIPVPKPEQQTPAVDFAAKQAELDQQAAALAQREKLLAEKETAARQAEVASFAASLVDGGKLLPAEQPAVEALLNSLSTQEQSVSFAAADGQVSKPAAQLLRDFLTGLPARVDFSEHSAPEDQGTATASFSAPAGYSVSKDRVELHHRILAYQKQHNTDYATAAAAVGA